MENQQSENSQNQNQDLQEQVTILQNENDAMLEQLEDLQTTVLHLLKGISRVEKQFGVKYMARGNFYGIEFK